MNKVISFTLCLLLWVGHIHAQKVPVSDQDKFAVSKSNVSLSENGGTQTIKVTSAKEWDIKKSPAKWVKLKRTGDTMLLNVLENESTDERSTAFSITSNGKDISISIKQAASKQPEPEINLKPESTVTTARMQNSTPTKPAAKDYFNISATSVTFAATGGTHTFKINASKSWRIDRNPASWWQLKRQGNSLTITVNANANTNATAKTDYFTLRSGNRSIRVDITQTAAPKKLEVSSTHVQLDAEGGTKTVTVTSNIPWQISTGTSNWIHLTKSGNSITINVDANKQPQSRDSYFTIVSDNKSIKVYIEQMENQTTLSVNGSTSTARIGFEYYGNSESINVVTNASDYEIRDIPSWCTVIKRTPAGFVLWCDENKSCYMRGDWLRIKANDKEVSLYVFQYADFDKAMRRMNGGWVNMALGIEGGYSIEGDNSWYANGIVGLRIGNYADIVQFELGVSPGIMSLDNGGAEFHMPAYASLKLSTRSGKFYFKTAGSYNQLIANDFEGDYSLRAGFGSAWKHFEWDWAYIQYNATTYDNLYNQPKWMAGMRMVWYITR